MCDNPDCKCNYCQNDNYDRYIGDHMREVLESINMFLKPLVKREDATDEEMFYSMIMYKAQEELNENRIN